MLITATMASATKSADIRDLRQLDAAVVLYERIPVPLPHRMQLPNHRLSSSSILDYVGSRATNSVVSPAVRRHEHNVPKQILLKRGSAVASIR